MSLPAPQTPATLPPQHERRDRSALSSGGRQHILLIEDSRSISRALAHQLQVALDAEITCCLTSKTCHEALADKSRRFDVAIVDLNLPGASDGEILNSVVAQGIPAVVFTARFDLDLREKVVERGVADYIIKDNDRALDMVVASVERLLNNALVKVLVVDDVRSARQGLVELLRLQRFNVIQARTGQQALEALDQDRDICLILTDYHMPDMNGYELTRLIRKRFASDELRIIGISSSSDRLLSASFLKAGACDFVYRPYVAEELQCRINLHVQALSQIRQLRAAAFQDYLTELYNRRYFFREGPALVERCLMRVEPCSVAILDIDHFKKLNDSFGHDSGDVVLKAVADYLKGVCCPHGALLGRLGGEEFGMILPNMSLRQALSFCDSIRGDIATLTVPLPAGETTVTVSIGLAEIGGRESFDNYLHAADQFLYLAKRFGRNQVYSDLSVLPEQQAAG
ncbi:GGDEF domain-containing response regulator [Rhizobium paknamense]